MKILKCKENTSLENVMRLMNGSDSKEFSQGIVIVIDENRKLSGVVTDGDIRRAFGDGFKIEHEVCEIMTNNPIYFEINTTFDTILRELPKRLEERKRRASRFLSKIVLVNDQKEPVKILEYHELWEQKVALHRHIVVVGLGYVGLTMALVMADAGFMITGVEIDSRRREQLLEGESYIHEQGLGELLDKEIGKNFNVCAEIPQEGDVYIITVGTPVVDNIHGAKSLNTSFLKEASINVGKKLAKGNLVVLRSTVPIGTTVNLVKPILEETSGLTCGVDFHLSFAPERTAEGKALKELRSLPQIIGGFTKESVESTAAIFRDLTPVLVRVKSIEEAEMAKLINNSFRDYVFAFANYASVVAQSFNIDIFDTIRAANEGYVRDPVPLPSPGVGGPCLTKDPYIFASNSSDNILEFNPFIMSRRTNVYMHEHVVNQVEVALKTCGKQLKNAKILIAGIAFKGDPETGDIRNSSSVEIAKNFNLKEGNISIYDPVASLEDMRKLGFRVLDIKSFYEEEFDAILFLNNHKSFLSISMSKLFADKNDNMIIYDGWNSFNSKKVVEAGGIYLNLSYSSI